MYAVEILSAHIDIETLRLENIIDPQKNEETPNVQTSHYCVPNAFPNIRGMHSTSIC